MRHATHIVIIRYQNHDISRVKNHMQIELDDIPTMINSVSIITTIYSDNTRKVSRIRRLPKLFDFQPLFYPI